MNKILSISRSFILWGVLSALFLSSIYNQFNYNLKPLYSTRNNIPSMIIKDDVQKLRVIAPDLFNLVEAVNTFPTSTRFYFIPCFEDSGNTGRWWWYVYLIVRYLSYPRTIFCHDKVQYKNSKEIYLERFIGQAKTWQALDWITSRHIEIIILMRNNAVEFIHITSPIKNL